MSIELTRFQSDQLDEAVLLSQAVGWPHRREDWELNTGISVGVAAVADGRLVGTAFMTPFGETCAAINLVIVDAAWRGRGLGRRLTAAALDLAGDRECRLVATEDGLPLYERLGFVAGQAVRQHQGIARAPQAPPTGHVTWAGEDGWRACAGLDHAAFGADRQDLFETLSGVARFAVLRQDGETAGFAALRPFGRGWVIGPVVARTDAQARDLIGFVLRESQGQFLRLDTTDDTGLSDWLAAHGLTQAGGGVAMRRGAHRPDHCPDHCPPRGDLRSFALVSQALG